MDIPAGQWVHLEIIAGLGSKSTGTWEMTVTVPGQAPRRFEGLKNVNADWKTLDWIGFVSNAKVNTVLYLDNIRIASDGA
jgi:hypothetical protein